LDFKRLRRPGAAEAAGPVTFFWPRAPYTVNIIEAHGLEEWKAVLLTNELRRHFGMCSIIGAKMGIRVREVLNAPFDEFLE